MGRKNFKADLTSASQEVASGSITGVTSIVRGESDGELVITFEHENLPTPIRVQALAQDVDEYPSGNAFMLFTDDEHAPRSVVTTLGSFQDYATGMDILELAGKLAKTLKRALDPDQGTTDDTVMSDSSDDAAGDESDFEDLYDDDDDAAFGLDSTTPRILQPFTTREQSQLRQRMKHDFREVRQAGFRVGALHDPCQQPLGHGLVSISIRANRLAIPEEAMEAWDVEDTDYVVLLIRYKDKYKTLEQVVDRPASSAQLSFRVGKCKRYKPSLKQALAAFDDDVKRKIRQRDEEGRDNTGTYTPDCGEFRKMFVSNSLDQFLNDSFISLLKIRIRRGSSWEEANEEFLGMNGQGLSWAQEDHDHLPDPKLGSGSGSGSGSGADPGPVDSDSSSLSPAFEPIFSKDHLTQNPPEGGRSFPLITMQFVLNYFARCTEYCLRCHRRLEKGFEALRPYVCSDPLCLFQYVTMGLGPSIEHEILTEPYVVDLLVSLCYGSIQSPYTVTNTPATHAQPTLPIRNFPVGLQVKVPGLRDDDPRIKAVKSGRILSLSGDIRIPDFLRQGVWIAFRIDESPPGDGQGLLLHAIIKKIDRIVRTIEIEVITTSGETWEGKHNRPTPPDGTVQIYPYEADLDALQDADKAKSMRHVLDTLPSIRTIETYLSTHPHSTIRSMESISPAARALLQWIVSSNRSCIYQVDRSNIFSREPPVASGSDTAVADLPVGQGRNREHERIPYLPDWIQFRFAQGSADKELRFNKALHEVAARRDISAHPTIFAWHGSALGNWHSILRTGLDFQDMRSGRAYGHGVYFSRHLSISRGYASGGPAIEWPNTSIRPQSCVSLNEIINCPSEFVSQSPHYVVSQLDWHQCRYLFVRSLVPQTIPVPTSTLPTETTAGHDAVDAVGTAAATTTPAARKFRVQAPGMEILDENEHALSIPEFAVPVRQVGTTNTPSAAPKHLIRILDEDSEGEEEADMKFLCPDDDAAADSEIQEQRGDRDHDVTPPESPPRSLDTSATDFRPGTLDPESLPRLAAPSWATDTATRALTREVKHMQGVQARTSLHELGWYIDFAQLTNLFQWIVELHSFDPTLPLARDMKAAGVTSLVLELRFGPEYPMTPPFVRIVRPRFLPFSEGGGGHVTGGGAMCMELLTTSGWLPSFSMENVLVQIRFALCNLEPRPARLMTSVTGLNGGGSSSSMDYGIQEAVDAYIRAARAHGWRVPEDLHVTARGGTSL